MAQAGGINPFPENKTGFYYLVPIRKYICLDGAIIILPNALFYLYFY